MAKTVSFARHHEEWLEEHPDLKKDFTGLLRTIDSRFNSFNLNNLTPLAEQPDLSQSDKLAF